MKLARLVFSLLLLCVLTRSLRAQDVPRAELFVGYSYLNVDTNNLSSRQSANGWEAAVSANVTRLFAVEGDVSGYYKDYNFNFGDLLPGTNGNLHVAVTDYSYMGGPRLNLRPAFIHALVGGDHLTGSALGLSASQDGLAAAFGGGIQLRVSRIISIRTSADYVLTRHNILGGSRIDQNNFRVGAGLVFAFGGKRGDSFDRPQRASRAAPPPVGEEAILFGISGVPTPRGVQVTLVSYQSAANRAGVQTDDVIVAIDGAQVRTIRDIEIAVGKNLTGSINVSYLTKGLALVNNTVQVAPPSPADNPTR